MKSKKSVWRKKIPGEFKRWSEGTLVCCDALDFLTNLRNEIADIVFLDPPFNLGKEYGSRSSKDDRKSQNDYFVFNIDL